MTRMPTVLIPYQLGCIDGPEEHCQDIFVYLRPETNGIRVESALLKVVQRESRYLENMELVYLANLPGDFMKENRIIEHHYRLKLRFCRLGKKVFTQYMRTNFEIYYGVPFEEARIIGGFEAMEIFGLSAEALAEIWVNREDILVLNGQNIKKYKDYFILNYDIPSVLLKNDVATDIAVMVFRTSLGYNDIHRMAISMGKELRAKGLVAEDVPMSRVFHYSKGPFEQISDAMGYLYNHDGSQIPLQDNHFVLFLQEHGFSLQEIEMAVLNPIMGFELISQVFIEDNLLIYTANDSYDEAMKKLQTASYQMI